METPRYGHAPIEMRHVDGTQAKDGTWAYGEDPDDKIQHIGDFYYYTNSDGTNYIVIAIPGGSVNRHPSAWTYSRWEIGGPGKRWEFSGTDDKPTMSPSLHAVGVWHGFVENGIMREA